MGALKDWLAGRSAARPANLPKRPKSASGGRRGALVALGSLFLLLLWGSLAPLDSAVIGHGLLKVESYRQVVQHQGAVSSRRSW